MLNTIEKLRERPVAYRKRIAFIIAISITGIIFLVWLSVLGVRFDNNKSVIVEVENDGFLEEAQKEFSGVFENGVEQFSNVKKELENLVGSVRAN